MEKRQMLAKLVGVVLSLPLLLSGCSIFPEISGREASRASLEISLGPIVPEGVTIIWDPAAVTVDSAEVSSAGNAADAGRAVIVTVQLRPANR